MKSSPENPWLFTFEGKIPSLKNGKMMVWEEDSEGGLKPKVFSNKEVTAWYEGQREPLMKQMARQAGQLDLITGKKRAYCRLELFSKTGLNSLDADNVYTTVQELLQIPSKPGSKRPHKGFMGLIDTDRYVQDHCVRQLLIEDVRGAFLWVWETTQETDDIDSLVIFKEWRESNLKKGSKRLTLPQTFFQ